MSRIVKRGDSYTCLVELPRDPQTGKRRQQRVTQATKRAVEQERTALLNQVQTGTFLEPTKLTTGAYLEDWLTQVPSTIREATLYTYTRIVRQVFVPALGSTPLPQLQALHIQRLYQDALRTRSTTTVRIYHQILHRALRQAVRWRLIRENPCDFVDPPTRRQREFPVWTASQAQHFLAATRATADFPLWLLALATGARKGELLALQWGDVDFAQGHCTIRRTLTRALDGRFVLGPTKSAAGQRVIGLPGVVVDVLRLAGTGQDPDGLVFPNRHGTAQSPQWVLSRFRRAQRGLGLPMLRFHDVRHSVATWMFEQGEYSKAVSERLGHTNVAFTLERYGHVTPAHAKGLGDRVGRFLEAE